MGGGTAPKGSHCEEGKTEVDILLQILEKFGGMPFRDGKRALPGRQGEGTLLPEKEAAEVMGCVELPQRTL